LSAQLLKGLVAMTAIPIDQIVEHNQQLKRYRLRIERPNGEILDNQIDQEEDRQQQRIYVLGHEAPDVEVIWTKGTAVGHKWNSDEWWSMSDSPPTEYFTSTIRLLKEVVWDSTSVDGGQWVMTAKLAGPEIADSIIAAIRGIFASPTTAKQERFLARAVELTQGLSLQLEMRIAQDTSMIDRLTTTCTSAKMHSQTTLVVQPEQVDTAYKRVDPLSKPHTLTGDGTFERSDLGVAGTVDLVAETGAGSPFSIRQHPATQTDIELGAAYTQATSLQDTPSLTISPIRIPSHLLLFALKDLGGWKESTHSAWAQRSLELVEKTDGEGLYAEIYDGSYSRYSEQDAGGEPNSQIHHPIILGAYYEDETNPLPDFYHEWFRDDGQYAQNRDYYYHQAGYWRDYHHFGGRELGLQDELRNSLRGRPQTTQPNDRFYSARDWGFGGKRIDESLNRLTFTEAMLQYVQATPESRRRALLMLGHVVHLLQDVGQPDHARLVAHPGSSRTERQMKEEIHYCDFVAGEAAAAAAAAGSWFFGVGALAGLAAYEVAYNACCDSTNDAEVGYERLLALKAHWRLDEVDPDIQATGVLRENGYDTFFARLADDSVRVADGMGLLSPLGCGDFSVALPEVGGGLDPDIDTNDPAQVRPYIDLTKRLVPEIVGMGAGFIEHFFDIVNPPPYVQRVTGVKAVPGLVPSGFGRLGDAYHRPDCEMAQVKYDAYWEPASEDRRVLKFPVVPQALSASHGVYIFVRFGPISTTGKARRMDLSSMKVTMVREQVPTKISIPVSMVAASDAKLGDYYWGIFLPPPYDTQLEQQWHIVISANDRGAHLQARKYPGHELDGNPQTSAMLQIHAPDYSFRGYEPGTDTCHMVQIAPPMLPDRHEPNNDFEHATPILALTGPSSVSENDLTLHDEQDHDFFAVHCTRDKSLEDMWSGIGKELSGLTGSGLRISGHGPQLHVMAEETMGGCISVCGYDNGRQPVKELDITAHAPFVPLSLNYTMFGDGGVIYLDVSNPNFASQGPLRYSLQVDYTPGGVQISGHFLYKFWERDGELMFEELGIDRPPTMTWWLKKHLPDPFPPWTSELEQVEFEVHDVEKLAVALEQAIPDLVTEIATSSGVDEISAEARATYLIGRLNMLAGKNTQTESLYRRSLDSFRRSGNTDMASTIEHELAGLSDATEGRGHQIKGQDEVGDLIPREELLGRSIHPR
jgi:hypothetical protein